MKDIFNENGVYRSLQEFSDILLNRSNWLCEYHVTQNVNKGKKVYCMI